MKFFTKNRVYLDYNATTRPRLSAIKAVKKALKNWGNPSSAHQNARKAKSMLWEARQNLSQFLNCHPLELIFTSGASESNNHVIKGLFQSRENKRNELIISAVEHPSILYTAEHLSKKGFKVHKIPVSRQGFLDEDVFEKHLSEKTLLVSIMSANNETGIVFPIQKWIKKTHEKGALFHSDMVQVLGKENLDLKKLELDFASFSGHKCYSLQGCGILYCKKGVVLDSLIHGGPQERQRRAGTENLTGIFAFGSVAREGDVIVKESQKLKPLRDSMEQYILSHLKKVEIVGGKANRLNNTSCLCILGVHGETLLMNLDIKGISISVGSACGSGKIESSSVLTAMGWTQEEALSSIRVSLGIGATKRQINYFQKTLVKSVNRLRSLK